MNKIKRRQFTSYAIMLVVFIIIGFILYGKFSEELDSRKQKPIGDYPPISLSAWVVDWDFTASIENLIQVKNNLSSLQLFLVYFNEDDQIIWDSPQQEKINTLLTALNTDESNSHPAPLYLTIVNDIVSEQDVVQKDAELVKRLVSSPQSQLRFIEQVISIAKQYHLSGIEIDFENLTDIDAASLTQFYTLLYTQLSQEQLQLRIVIEPKMKFESISLPVGPQYVVMAYNLHGFHSAPGPKANIPFIGKLTARMEGLPQNSTVAIATGGFMWSENGAIASISELQAVELQKKASDNTIVRDEPSQAISFIYEDLKGEKHTIWYADHITLKHWIKAIQQRGFSNIALWRLGQLTDETLAMLNQINETLK